MAIAGSLVVTVTARTSDFEAGMRKTTQTLKLTQQQAAQVTNAFAGLGNAFTQVGSKAKQTSGIMADLKGNLLGLAAGVLSFQALRAGIEGSVQAALKLEALNTAFKVITGSAQGAAEAMKFVRDTGERLGVQVDSISTGYKTLLASIQGTSMTLKEAQTLFLGVVEGSRALGLSAEDTAGALRPLTQIISQQAFQADELRNELGSRLPGVMQMLVTASNGAFKSVGDLTKAMEDGKLKGQAALDLAANFGEVLRNKFAPAAMEAARGTQAAFDGLQTAVNELAVEFGRSLAPALAEAARALTVFLTGAKQGAGVLGGALIEPIRQATSVLIGLAGAFVVTGKAIAAFTAGLIDDTEAARIGWEDVGKTITDIVALQTKVISGGFAQQPGGTTAAPGMNRKPFTPGGGEDGKKKKKTEAEKEAERIAERQKDLILDIANAYDAANAAVESGIDLERTRLEQRLKEAQFSQADLDTLMATYDATERLLKQREDDKRLAQERLQLSTQLQESLDKQLYTERELFDRKLTALGFTKEEAAVKLKMFDTEVRLREEAEKRKEAEQEAVQATKEHLEKLERLQERLQPRLRQTRAQELQGVVSEVATETSDPYQLQLAANQMQETLATEQWQEWRDFAEDSLDKVGDAITQFAFHGKLTFKDMVDSIAEDFFRMSLRMLTESAFSSAGGKGGWLDLALQAGKSLLGIAGGVSGGGGGRFAGGDAPGMQHGGPVMPGKFYTVGERGPEIFMPHQSGTIVPHGASMQVAAPTINVYIQGVTNPNEWRPSQGAVSRTVAGAVSQAYRGL